MKLSQSTPSPEQLRPAPLTAPIGEVVGQSSPRHPGLPVPGWPSRTSHCCSVTAQPFGAVVQDISARYAGRVDVVVGIEARGLILGVAVAYDLGIGFVPVRKVGKLSGRTHSAEYDLEYGSAVIEVHADAFTAGKRAPVMDDVLVGAPPKRPASWSSAPVAASRRSRWCWSCASLHGRDKPGRPPSPRNASRRAHRLSPWDKESVPDLPGMTTPARARATPKKQPSTASADARACPADPVLPTSARVRARFARFGGPRTDTNPVLEPLVGYGSGLTSQGGPVDHRAALRGGGESPPWADAKKW